MQRVSVWLLVLVVVLGACGGDGGVDSGSGSQSETENDGFSSGAAGGSSSAGGDEESIGGESVDGAQGQANATLIVGDVTYTWERNQWTYCEIGGTFPASVEFQMKEIKHDGDWFQFFDRGDGGINFSAVLGGEEYGGTGAGEADEITSNGFTYSGALNNQGQRYDVELAVSCG